MERIDNVHPGEVLLEEFLIPLDITAYRLSKDLEIPQTRVSEILKGRRRITADTALRLSKYFGNSPKFWLGLQDDYDFNIPGAIIIGIGPSIGTRFQAGRIPVYTIGNQQFFFAV